ncbi:MAG: hypothetical protein NT027_03410, partial [Proteobacteria bacterium]|nr:hypothetical protein [Pseudomonadota bacterium]
RIGQYGEMYCIVPENIYSALSKKFNGSVFRNVQVSTERDSLKIDLPISGNKISELANKEIARSGSSVKISYGNLFNNRFLSPITAIDFGFNKDYMVETRWGQISTVLAPYLYMDYIVLGSQYLVTKGGVLIQRLGSSENPIFETFMDQRPDVPIFRNLKFRQSADLRSVELEFRLLTKETLHKLDFKVVGTTDLYQCDFTSNVLASDREMYSGCAIAISGTPRKIGSFAEVKFTFKGGRTQTEVARREVRRRTGDGDMLMNHELYDNLLSEGAVKQVIGVKEDGLIVVPNVPEESDVDLIAGGANCKRLKVSRDRDLGFQRLCVAKVPSSGDRGFIAKINGRVAYRSFSPTLDNTEESQDRIDVLRSRVRDYAPLGDDENVIVHMAEDNSFLNLEMLYYVDSFYNKKYPCKPMYEDFDAGINNEGQNVGKFKLATHCKLKRSDSGVVENLSREYVFSSGVTVSARPSWHYSKDHDLNGWPEDNYVQVTEIDNLFFVQQGSTSSPNTSCSQICDEYLPKALVYKSALNTENNCKLLYDKIKRPVSNYGHGYALEVFEIPSAGSYGNGCATVKRKTKATSPFDIDEQTVYSFKPYNEKDLGPSTNLLNPYSQQLKICPCVSKN